MPSSIFKRSQLVASISQRYPILNSTVCSDPCTHHLPEALRDGEAEIPGGDLTRVDNTALENLGILEELLLEILHSKNRFPSSIPTE